MYRTTFCGALTEESVGKTERVCGWIAHKRDMGGIIFIDLRDREGTLQVVFNEEKLPAEQFAAIESARLESVIMADGVIRIRDEETYNPRLKTGTIELAATGAEIISEADPLPFSLDEAASVREDTRLAYRFLDLRRPVMQDALRFRHEVVRAARRFLDDAGFVEIETPMLTKSTPEGARDYLVPSRVHPGEFYALPQSPQIFKQLLMVGGADRYYQVARCFRDEDLRADRQPEFTQLDMELSFSTQEEILVHIEKLFKHIMRTVKGIDITSPFPRLTWKTAMDVYGSDKPDIRFGLPIVDLTDIARDCGFSVFRAAARKGGVVRAINVKTVDFSHTDIEQLTERALQYGAKGMAWIMIRPDGSVNSILQKFFSSEDWDALMERTGAQPGDFILFCADSLSVVRRTLGGLRLDLGDMLGLRDKSKYEFLVVTDFPQFEYSEEEGRYVAMHHPFTMPYPEDVQYLLTDPERVRAQAYDFVLNGIELGSGSIRIHDREVQRLMFQALGFEEEDIQRRFGFMLRAFSYGTPPHGGFAFGLDRLVMLLLGADSLRSVIAFPKTKDARCLLTGAPDFVDESQLRELSLLSSGTETEAAPVAKEKPKKRKVEFNVSAVAKLAGLSLSPEETDTMKRELGSIIAFADTLGDADVDSERETAHIIPISNVFRDDTAVRGDTKALLRDLKSVEFEGSEYFQVPHGAID